MIVHACMRARCGVAFSKWLTLPCSRDLGRNYGRRGLCVCFTIMVGDNVATTSSCTWCEDVDPRRCARPRTTSR